MALLTSHLLTFLVFFPAVGALGLLFLRSEDETFTRRLTFVIALVEFLASLPLLGIINVGSKGYALEEAHAWIHSPQINYHLGADGISGFLVILTAFLTVLSVLASEKGVHHRIKEFHVMLLLLEVGIIGVFLALDLFLFFLFWEVMLIPMAFLIGIWGHDRRIYAAVKFFIYTMFGSAFMLLGILWLYLNAHSFDLPAIQAQLQSGQLVLSQRTELLLFLSFFLAFAIKVPLFPLHTWLPDAHVEAPTAGSIMLAGVLLKMGTYGMIRFCLPLFPDATRRCAGWIAVLAIIGIVYGALVALVQPNLKKLIAYSSVSHLGFVVLGLFALHNISVQGAVYQMLAHGISTGALFFLAGMLFDRRHTYEITEYGGLCALMPKFAAFFLFMSLASMGLPMLNGFVGEFLILLGTYQVHWSWASWAATGVILSACYLLWLYQRLFYGDVTNDKNKQLQDSSARETWALVAFAIVTLWMGIGSSYITNRTAARVDQILKEEMSRPGYAQEAVRPSIPAAPAAADSDSLKRMVSR